MELLWSSMKALLVLSTLLFSSSAYTSNVVKILPGFDGPLPFHLETGYIAVEEDNDVQLFYYFIKSDRSPKEDPLIVWITGGPYCSSFTALAFEIGPLRFDVKEYKGELPTLVAHPYSWTKVSNALFIDTPVWTGFSYSKSSTNKADGDIISSKRVSTFVKKWLEENPKFKTNPLYIGGDSYSGKVVPVITHELMKDIEDGRAKHLNLKGYVAGNPLTSVKIDFNAIFPYAHRMGFISDELYKSAKKRCRGQYLEPMNAQCVEDVKAMEILISGIDARNILEKKCVDDYYDFQNHATHRRSLVMDSQMIFSPPPSNLTLDCRSYRFMLSYFWANNEIVREALHVKKGTIKEWIRCNKQPNYVSDIPSSLPFHFDITTRGYRALMYSGDHDMTIPYLGTQEAIKSLNFPVIDQWRPFTIDGQVAGFTISYANNLTFALVKGGGHTSPEMRPKECHAMFERWISFKPL
ncbi:Serine carboxypeptidase-like 18 [Acorus calamus]|uniref:Serine carboxypeptidase-like 18 n=1 Tax=Acorus calamus TaxID=4465 RepID=A0AAV9ELQ2_ACOCL|nr:Serine carboxypeptidase-like 18 [Acorus calamus]